LGTFTHKGFKLFWCELGRFGGNGVLTACPRAEIIRATALRTKRAKRIPCGELATFSALGAAHDSRSVHKKKDAPEVHLSSIPQHSELLRLIARA